MNKQELAASVAEKAPPAERDGVQVVWLEGGEVSRQLEAA